MEKETFEKGDLEKDGAKPTKEPADPPPHQPAITLSAGLNKCPACRAAVTPTAGEWIACGQCLVRHHQRCWSQSGRCAACGSTSALEPPRGRRRVVVAAVVVGIVLAAAVAGLLATRRNTRPGVCSWAGIKPGTSFKYVVRNQVAKPSPGQAAVTTGWWRKTLISRNGDRVRVRAERDIPPFKPSEGELDDALEDDLRTGFALITNRTQETIEGPAGRIPCEHFTGEGNRVNGVLLHLDIWIADGVPYPVKAIKRHGDDEDRMDLVEIKRP